MSWDGAQGSRIGEMESEVLDRGAMVCARHLIPAGFDSAPLYRGLPDDMCPCEHWCYLARGRLRYRFADGEAREVEAGDAFHLQAGHHADVLEDAELIEFTVADDYPQGGASGEVRVTAYEDEAEGTLDGGDNSWWRKCSASAKLPTAPESACQRSGSMSGEASCPNPNGSAAYEASPDCTVRVHCDDQPAPRLLVPIIAQ